jgi:hypothetical protein
MDENVFYSYTAAPTRSEPFKMSQIYEGQDKLDIAAKAEQDLNSHDRKFGVQDGTGFGGKTVGGGSTSSQSPSTPTSTLSPLLTPPSR